MKWSLIIVLAVAGAWSAYGAPATNPVEEELKAAPDALWRIMYLMRTAHRQAVRDATDKFRASAEWHALQARLAVAEKKITEIQDSSAPFENRSAALDRAWSDVAAAEKRAVRSDPLVQLAAARLKKAEEEVAKLPPTPEQIEEEFKAA